MPFQVPEGIVTVQIDPASGLPATPNCPITRAEVYIAGTQPVGSCPLHGGHTVTNVAGWDTEAPQQRLEPPPQVAPGRPEQPPAIAQHRAADPPFPPAPPEETPKPKKGFFRRLLGVFK